MKRTSVIPLSLLTAVTLAWSPLVQAQLAEKPAPSAGLALARQLNEAYVSVFERVAPAVVVIDVTKKSPEAGVNPMDFFGDAFGRPGDDEQDGAPPAPRNRQQPAPRRSPRAPQPQSEGSGFVIKADGFILTNAHVVNGADKINVRLKDGRNLPGKLIGADEKTDIAIIKVDAAGLPVATLANSDTVRVGEIVFAIGAPYNLDYTFTAGIVSAKGRNRLNVTPDGYEDFIQTDASINPGNSGGPLVNLDGQVIGMNTLINGINRGLGFAIPANMMRDVGGQLMEGGRVVRPYLGIRIESYEDYAKRSDAFKFDGVKSGVVVVTIEPDTPAANSDLHPADVITQVDGKEVRTADELRKLVLTKKVGSKVDLSVVRKGKAIQVAVTTAELPGERPVVETQREVLRRPVRELLAEVAQHVLAHRRVVLVVHEEQLERRLARRGSFDRHGVILGRGGLVSAPAGAEASKAMNCDRVRQLIYCGSISSEGGEGRPEESAA